MSGYKEGHDFLDCRLQTGPLEVPPGSDRLDGELHQPGAGKPLQHGLERALLGDPAVDGLLAAEAGGESTFWVPSVGAGGPCLGSALLCRSPGPAFGQGTFGALLVCNG